MPNLWSTLLTYQRRHRLTFRLMLAILGCSVGFTCLSTFFQLSADRRRDLALIETRIENIRESYGRALADSVWYFDTELIGSQLEGILQLPDIVYLEILGETGEVVMQAGTPPTARHITRRFPLFRDRDGQTSPIGTVRIEASLHGVDQRLRERFLVILFTQAATIFLLSLCIVALFQALVVRHLAAMAKYTRHLNLTRLDTRLRLSRRSRPSAKPDELDQVVTAINDMQQRMKADILKREEAEAELRAAKTEAIQAQKQAEAAQRASDVANRAKSTFLANVSHELRTPLNAILGFAQLLDRTSYLRPEHQEFLTSIRRSGEHLLTLINQVLNLSKIEEGHLAVDEQNFDLYQLLDDVERLFRLRVQEKQISLRFEHDAALPRYVRTDRVKLLQVLINLLTNAIKFTEHGGVSLYVEPDHDQAHTDPLSLVFTVSDTGIGIASEDLDHIFDPFVQSLDSRNVSEGAGLGLAISKRFLDLLGGEITLESEVGRGTTIRFRIPAALVSASVIAPGTEDRKVIALEPNQKATRAVEAHQYRILVVDDTRDNRQILVKLLEPLGFDLREAVNGQEALEIWQNWQPHLIWMDLKMPGVDGYEATHKIREMESRSPASKTCIIAITAMSFEHEEQAVLAAGCDGFVRKPFHESDIFEMLQTYLGVSFVYETAEQMDVSLQKAQDILTAERLAEIPNALLAEFAAASETISMAEIATLIDIIRERDSTLGQALDTLVKHYRFDILQELFEAIPLEKNR